MTPKALKALIEDLRLNHEFCPKEVILQAADELERLAQLEQEPVVERAWFTIAELNAWAEKKLLENPQWVMPQDEPERDETLARPERSMKVEGPLHVVCQCDKCKAQPTPVQEPVAWEQFYPDIGKPEIAFNSEVVGYVAPQRTWVGLTDEEIKEIVGPWGDTPIKGYTRLLFDQIEAKLRSKNNG